MTPVIKWFDVVHGEKIRNKKYEIRNKKVGANLLSYS